MNNINTTEIPSFSEYTTTDNKNISYKLTKDMEEINADTKIEELEYTDYPYIGLGRKPNRHVTLSDEQLENLIGG